MSIQDLIEKVCVQDLVYWEFIGTDEYGGGKYKDPIQTKCRMDQSVKVVAGQDGIQYVSETQLIIPHDMEERSLVILGDIMDYTTEDDPTQIDDTREIQAMDRHPLFASKTFDVFLAYL